MADLASRLILTGVAGAVFIAAVDDVKVLPARAINAVTTAVVTGSGASTTVSQSIYGITLPPEIVVIDQNTGDHRVGPLWLARQRITDHSKERVAQAGALSISLS